MKVKIKTPCRLHFTLIDENGSIGRIDGGIGLTLEEPNFTIEVSDNIDIKSIETVSTETDLKDKFQRIIKTNLGKIIIQLKLTDCSKPTLLLDIIADVSTDFITNLLTLYPNLHSTKFPIKMIVTDFLSAHLGYGSKTQMSLAIAKGLACIMGLEEKLNIIQLAELVSRGGTSGIGFRSFEQGGFILDAGHHFGNGREKETFLPSSASKAKPARTLVRYDFPEDWWILAVTLNVKAGASNVEEVNIFQEFCPVPIEEVREVSHIILMQLLPSIVEHDLSSLGVAIEKIQDLGFKKIEVSLQHDAVKSLIGYQREAGAPCVGMSSFGPTVYSIFQSKKAAEEMLQKIETKFKEIGCISYLTKANNNGAKIEYIEY